LLFALEELAYQWCRPAFPHIEGLKAIQVAFKALVIPDEIVSFLDHRNVLRSDPMALNSPFISLGEWGDVNT
jgi:hypothetical protein